MNGEVPARKKRVVSRYCEPWVVALRTAPDAAVCIDDDCELSGFYAHVGPCEPCSCGLNHAIEECPENRTDGCRACNGSGYFVCLNCKGVGLVPAHPEHAQRTAQAKGSDGGSPK